VIDWRKLRRSEVFRACYPYLAGFCFLHGTPSEQQRVSNVAKWFIHDPLYARCYIADLGQPLSGKGRCQLQQSNVAIEERPLLVLAPDGSTILAHLCDGTSERFDLMYSALSCGPVPALADNSSGCRLGSDGRSIVTEHRQTSEPDVWAAGDVVRGLNQISVATGEAAAMHNRLAGRHS
jgi:Pyridine nucleotide-disulphide oxidoreductase